MKLIESDLVVRIFDFLNPFFDKKYSILLYKLDILLSLIFNILLYHYSIISCLYNIFFNFFMISLLNEELCLLLKEIINYEFFYKWTDIIALMISIFALSIRYKLLTKKQFIIEKSNVNLNKED